MKAYQIKYQHNGRDVTYVLWKIAKTKQEASSLRLAKQCQGTKTGCPPRGGYL